MRFINRPCPSALRACALSALALLASPAPAAPANVAIDAADPRFRYEGRFDDRVPAAPVVVWEASRILIDFSGDALGLRFAEPSDQAYFDAVVDGRSSLVSLRRGAPAKGVSFHGLGEGRHSLVLFKRSEASAGSVAFLGITLNPGSVAWAPAPTRVRLRMEFIGDSITVGACDEDGALDQWDDRSTHNTARSYAWLAGLAFQADCRVFAVSGMGVCTGYVDVRAAQAWDGLYPTAASPRADLTRWSPDVVFINLGDNDESFTRKNAQPFPADFTRQYVALARAVRKAHPRAWIVLLRGGMSGGATRAPLREAWQKAVSQLEASDPRVRHFVFTHYSELHPRASDHRLLAEELIGWLRGQPFMRGR